MRLILTRHGETIWNKELRTQGKTDIPLSAEGEAQAARLGERLASLEVSAVYTSPLSRAVNTAAILAKPHGLTPLCHNLLTERDFGIWEGEPFSALCEKYPEQVALWKKDPVEFTPPKAEPLLDVWGRCTRFLAEITPLHASNDICVVVGHSVPIRLLVAHLLSLSPEKLHNFWLDNTSYTEFSLQGNHNVLIVLNDCSHLKGSV